MYRQNAAPKNASNSNNRCIDKMPLPKNASNSNNWCIYLGSLGSVTAFKDFFSIGKVSLVTPALLALDTLLKQKWSYICHTTQRVRDKEEWYDHIIIPQTFLPTNFANVNKPKDSYHVCLDYTGKKTVRSCCYCWHLQFEKIGICYWNGITEQKMPDIACVCKSLLMCHSRSQGK